VRHTGTLILLPLSARFSTTSDPGNTITPIGGAARRGVVPFREPGALVPGPVWLEGDLHDLPILGLATGNALGSLETAPVERKHVGMLGASPAVRRPDAGVLISTRI
jgi:hypothetical protein